MLRCCSSVIEMPYLLNLHAQQALIFGNQMELPFLHLFFFFAVHFDDRVHIGIFRHNVKNCLVFTLYAFLLYVK